MTRPYMRQVQCRDQMATKGHSQRFLPDEHHQCTRRAKWLVLGDVPVCGIHARYYPNPVKIDYRERRWILASA